MEQKRDEEAQEWLKVAIGIAESTEGVKGSINPGMAHCLLAQTMERQKQVAIPVPGGFANGEWKKCRELGSITSPDEDALLYQADQKLKKK